MLIHKGLIRQICPNFRSCYHPPPPRPPSHNLEILDFPTVYYNKRCFFMEGCPRQSAYISKFYLLASPGAQKVLFRIASTKVLKYIIKYRTDRQDPKRQFLSAAACTS